MNIAILSQLGFDAWLTLFVLATCLMLLVFEVFKPEIVLSGSVIALTLAGVISPSEAVVGFHNTAVITVALLFIVVAALRQSGVINHFAEWFLGQPQKHNSVLRRLLLLASTSSAFINNTPVVAMLTDVAQSWCQKHPIAISKLLIPLSYATIVGGMCTLIGTSTNLVIVGLMQQYQHLPQLSMFSPAWVGMPVCIVTLVYLLTLGNRLLPEHYIDSNSFPDAPEAPSKRELFVEKIELWLKQNSRFSLALFRQQYAEQSSAYCISEPAPDQQANDISARPSNKAWTSLAILLAMVFASTVLHIDIFVAVMTSVIALLITGNISFFKALFSIDYALIISIASAFALGMALDKTGVANAIASFLLSFANDNPYTALVMVYLLTIVFTEVLTNNATAVLMFPIAMSASEQLAVSPMPFIMAVMIAASASFITPIGYQTNMMVYGPGRYRFMDYVKVGTPLTVIVSIVSLTVIPLIWSFKVPFVL